MIKYALINRNKIQNIIACESEEFIKHIKSSYQYIKEINENNSNEVQIGYLWDGSKFFEDPIIVEQRKIQEEKYQEYINSLKEKNSNDLTDKEKQILEIEKGV